MKKMLIALDYAPSTQTVVEHSYLLAKAIKA